MIELDEDTRDALAETFNLALGHAAQHLAEMVGTEVQITLPEVALIPGSELLARVPARGARLCAVSQRFDSRPAGIHTEAVVLFSEAGALQVLQRLLGDRLDARRLGALEQEALAEVGNVILNSCLNRLALVYGRPMTGTLPQLRQGTASELLGRHGGEQPVLWGGVGLGLSGQAVDAQVLFFMDLASLRTAIHRVQCFFGMAPEAA